VRFIPACLQTEPRWNEAERSAKSEKRMWKQSEERVQVWSQASPAAAVCDFAAQAQPACVRNRSSKDRSLTLLAQK
jgi:hypothetical protein